MELHGESRLYYDRSYDIYEAMNVSKMESKYSDLEFACQDKETCNTVYLKAHTILFSSLSNLLKHIFDIARTKQPYENIVITLDSFDSNVVENLIQYIYEGSIIIDEIQQCQLRLLCDVLGIKIPMNDLISIDVIGVSGIERCENEQRDINDYIEYEYHTPSRSTKKDEHYISSITSDLGDSLRSNTLNEFEKGDHSEEMYCNTVGPIHMTWPKFELKEEIKDRNRRIDEISERFDFRGYAPRIPNDQHCIYLKEEASCSSSGKPCKCSECGFMASSRKSLTNHMNEIHDTTNFFKCSNCDYLAKTKSNLKLHLNAKHFKIKYSCDECSFSTTYKQLLQKHRNGGHDKIMKYKCHVCEYVTPYKSQLDKHMKCHDMQKLYTCDECSFTTAYKNSMKQHRNVVHNKMKEYKCNMCEYRGGQKVQVDRHKKRMHSLA